MILSYRISENSLSTRSVDTHFPDGRRNHSVNPTSAPALASSRSSSRWSVSFLLTAASSPSSYIAGPVLRCSEGCLLRAQSGQEEGRLLGNVRGVRGGSEQRSLRGRTGPALPGPPLRPVDTIATPWKPSAGLLRTERTRVRTPGPPRQIRTTSTAPSSGRRPAGCWAGRSRV